MRNHGWMGGLPSGNDLRTVLLDAGVRGAWLTKLAEHPNLTVGLVREEWASICRDPNVRNRAAVLVARLRDMLDVRVGRSPMSPDENEMYALLETRRRNMGGANTA